MALFSSTLSRGFLALRTKSVLAMTSQICSHFPLFPDFHVMGSLSSPKPLFKYHLSKKLLPHDPILYWKPLPHSRSHHLLFPVMHYLYSPNMLTCLWPVLHPEIPASGRQEFLAAVLTAAPTSWQAAAIQEEIARWLSSSYPLT